MPEQLAGGSAGNAKPGGQLQQAAPTESATPESIPPPQPWMQQFLVNQSREIDLRFAQLELAKSQEQHGFEYAQQALSAQSGDREQERVSREKTWSRTLLAFFATLTLAGYGQIALELAKVVIYGGLGAVGGYGYGRRHKPAS